MKTVNLQVGIALQGVERDGTYPVFDLIPLGISGIRFPAKVLMYIYVFPIILMFGWDASPQVVKA